jgi:hypothetical protein
MSSDPGLEQLGKVIKAEFDELNALYPWLPRTHTDLNFIEAATQSGEMRWFELQPQIVSYVYLRIRGYHSQVAFMWIFFADNQNDPLHNPMDLNRAVLGFQHIESSKEYKQEYERQHKALDLSSLWNPHISCRMLNRIVTGGGSDKVRIEAMQMCDCVSAYYTLSDDSRCSCRMKKLNLKPASRKKEIQK